MPLALPRSRSVGRTLGLVAGAFLVSLTAPVEARPERGLSRVDLSVRPGDLKLPPTPKPMAPLVSTEPATAAGEPVYALSDQVEATDRVRRGEIPDRRRLQNGLGIGPDSGLLAELLEDQTIPLFWVTVEPPF